MSGTKRFRGQSCFRGIPEPTDPALLQRELERLSKRMQAAPRSVPNEAIDTFQAVALVQHIAESGEPFLPLQMAPLEFHFRKNDEIRAEALLLFLQLEFPDGDFELQGRDSYLGPIVIIAHSLTKRSERTIYRVDIG